MSLERAEEALTSARAEVSRRVTPPARDQVQGLANLADTLRALELRAAVDHGIAAAAVLGSGVR